MRRLMVLCSAVVLAACAKKDQPPGADTTAMAPPPATMADMAGKWTMQSSREGSDSVLVTYEINATADTSGWTITFPGRDPMPLRVSPMAGDSVVTEVGPYESVLRNGVQVWTRSVMRMEGGNLVGTTVAHYSVNTADSVVNLRMTGTRAP